MDIRVTSTDKIFYQVDPLLAALLMEAFPASFEPARFNVEPTKQAAPQTPTFVARIGPRSGKPEIVMFYMGQEEFYSGSPDDVEGMFGGRARRTPPPEVVEQYRAVIAKQNAHSRDRLGRF